MMNCCFQGHKIVYKMFAERLIHFLLTGFLKNLKKFVLARLHIKKTDCIITMSLVTQEFLLANENILMTLQPSYLADLSFSNFFSCRD